MSTPVTPREWAEKARRWSNEHPPPLGAPAGSRVARGADELAEWSRWTQELHAAGLAIPQWPLQWGGADVDFECLLAIARVLRAAGQPLPLSDIGIGLVGPAIIKFGSAEQQDTHLPRIVAGTTVWSQLFSEPGAGSDLAGLRTTATRVPGGYQVNGQKVWNTYAHVADWGYLLARTGELDGRHHGLTLFLVDMRTAGINVRNLREITGDGDFNEVFLDDVFVPDDNVLGAVGDGWTITMSTLADERQVVGALAVSLEGEVARLSSFMDLLDVDDRTPFSDRLDVLIADVEALGALAEAKLHPGTETITKIAFGELNLELHQFAVELATRFPDSGPRGWRERWSDNYLYGRAYTISGGANEVLRNVIAKRGLKVGSDHVPAGLTDAGPDALASEAEALAALVDRSDSDEDVWDRLKRDGWLDLAPDAPGAWDLVHVASSVTRQVVERRGSIGVGAHLAAAAIAQLLGRPVPSGSIAALVVDGRPTGTGFRGTYWGADAADLVVVVLADGTVGVVSTGSVRREPAPIDLLEVVGVQTAFVDDVDSHDIGPGRATAVVRYFLALEAHSAASAATTATLTHLGTRTQFGAPLGSFQALQHRVVDMHLKRMLLGRAVAAAANDLATGSGQASARAAQLSAGRHGLWVAEQAIQLHGAMGFTWETGLHMGVRMAQRARLLLSQGDVPLWHSRVAGSGDGHLEDWAARASRVDR